VPSYGFYGRDINWDEINKLPWWHRPLHIAKGLFLAMFYKLTAPRRHPFADRIAVAGLLRIQI